MGSATVDLFNMAGTMFHIAIALKGIGSGDGQSYT
jgi:hypothetical protein